MMKKTVIEIVPYNPEHSEIPKFCIEFNDLFRQAYTRILQISELMIDGEHTRVQSDPESIREIASLVAIGTTGQIVLNGATAIAIYCFNDMPYHVTRL